MVDSLVQQTSVEYLLWQVLSWALQTEQGAAEAKLRQAPGCSRTYILLRETVNKLVEKHPDRKRADGDNKQGDSRDCPGQGGCCGLSGQGGLLRGGDPGLRPGQEVAGG